ncbi:MAG: hypothetical protein AAFX93_08790 [Verrucomicrobiota bacterium]
MDWEKTDSQWIFGSGLPGWALAVVLVIAGVVLWNFYRLTLAPIPLINRTVLGGLRITWIALLLVCLWNPSQETTFEKTIGEIPAVHVAVDLSASMGGEDPAGEAQYRETLEVIESLRDTLPDDNAGNIKWWSVGDSLKPYEATDFPAQSRSDISRQLNLLARTGSSDGRSQVIFLLSDGKDTSDNEGVGWQFPAGTRVFPILPDWRVQDTATAGISAVEGPVAVNIKERYQLRAILESSRHAQDPHELELRSGGQLIEKKPVDFIGGMTIAESFTTIEGAPGQRIFEFVLRNRTTGEAVDRFYHAVTATQRDSLRVLVLQGSLDWEPHYIRKAVAENPSIEIDTVSRLSEKTYRVEIGETAKNVSPSEAYRAVANLGDEYDVVLLANVGPKLLDSNLEAQLLSLLRERGGGILFLNGNPVQASAFSGSVLESLLPVVFTPNPEGVAIVDPFARNFVRNVYRGNRMTSNEHAFVDQMQADLHQRFYTDLKSIELTDEAASSQIWADSGSDGIAALPTPPKTYISYAQVEKEKPAATVLAVHAEDAGGTPLMAAQSIGRGRSVFIGVDNLWRWRMETESLARGYDRFWQQLLLWLGENASIGSQDLILDEPRYVGGETANLTFRYLTPDGQEPVIELASSVDSRESKLLEADSWSTTTGRGTVSIPINNERGDALLVTLSGKPGFEPAVVLNRRPGTLEEWYDGVDLDYLEAIALAGKGQILRSDEVQGIRKIFNEQMKTITQTERRALWRQGWLLLAIIGLYAMELALRRRWLLL